MQLSYAETIAENVARYARKELADALKAELKHLEVDEVIDRVVKRFDDRYKDM